MPGASVLSLDPPEGTAWLRDWETGLIQLAGELTPASFAAYLDVGAHEGMRPGELDALR